MNPTKTMSNGTTTKAGERTHTFVPWVIQKELNNAWRRNFMRRDMRTKSGRAGFAQALTRSGAK